MNESSELKQRPAEPYAGLPPALQQAFSGAAHSRASSMASAAPKVKDAEVDIIKAALHNPLQKPDNVTSLIGAGGSLGMIVAALKDIFKGPIGLFDVALAMLGMGLLVAQVVVYAMKRQTSDSEPFHALAKSYVNVLMQEIEVYRRSYGLPDGVRPPSGNPPEGNANG
ncbi:hypothetical protein [Polyangium spumosum]|uniref:Uncharacterized protein n=1 Tax=Polyangium spumosum TaxID=889282 RepID=A0A6N7PYH3_9BACT|nr:hypothetical protein [Polyangium spumosum]MRG97128.1 hypothetical protein [Polyangium spumosum]